MKKSELAMKLLMASYDADDVLDPAFTRIVNDFIDTKKLDSQIAHAVSELCDEYKLNMHLARSITMANVLTDLLGCEDDIDYNNPAAVSLLVRSVK